MTRPPQLHSNPVTTAGEIAACVRLKRQGMTLRQIAAELGLSKDTVSRRLDAGITATISPEVEELRASETARLEGLRKALTKGVRSGDVPAISESRRISESLRKLHGADAPQVTTVQLSARTTLDANVVVDALLATIPAVLAAAGLDAVRQEQLLTYGLQLAQHALAQAAGQPTDGPPPQPPRPRLAITAGERPVRAHVARPQPEPPVSPPDGLTPREKAVLADVLADVDDAPPPPPKHRPNIRTRRSDRPAPKDDISGWPRELRDRMHR